MHIEMPQSFVPVSEPEFEEFLASCADYRRDAFANATRYYFAHNQKTFAMVKVGKHADAVFVDPSLIKPQPQPTTA